MNLPVKINQAIGSRKRGINQSNIVKVVRFNVQLKHSKGIRVWLKANNFSGSIMHFKKQSSNTNIATRVNNQRVFFISIKLIMTMDKNFLYGFLSRFFI